MKRSVLLKGGPVGGRYIDVEDSVRSVTVSRYEFGRFVPMVYRARAPEMAEFVFDPEAVPQWFAENDPLSVAAAQVIERAKKP